MTAFSLWSDLARFSFLRKFSFLLTVTYQFLHFEQKISFCKININYFPVQNMKESSVNVNLKSTRKYNHGDIMRA